MSKVLLVEDDQFITHIYERAFRMAGHEIEVVNDAEAAWTALSTASAVPSIILLDITLPKMSGADFLKMVRADTRFESVPIAALTNSFDDSLEKKLAEAGVDLYLIKVNHEPKDIVAKAEALIKSGRVKREVSPVS